MAITLSVAAGCAAADALPTRPIDVATAQCPALEYPVEARRFETVGVTQVFFTLDARGDVTEATVRRKSGPTRIHELLDQTAVKVIKKCRFAEAPGFGPATAVQDFNWDLK